MAVTVSVILMFFLITDKLGLALRGYQSRLTLILTGLTLGEHDTDTVLREFERFHQSRNFVLYQMHYHYFPFGRVYKPSARTRVPCWRVHGGARCGHGTS